MLEREIENVVGLILSFITITDTHDSYQAGMATHFSMFYFLKGF